MTRLELEPYSPVDAVGHRVPPDVQPPLWLGHGSAGGRIMPGAPDPLSVACRANSLAPWWG